MPGSVAGTMVEPTLGGNACALPIASNRLRDRANVKGLNANAGMTATRPFPTMDVARR